MTRSARLAPLSVVSPKPVTTTSEWRRPYRLPQIASYTKLAIDGLRDFQSGQVMIAPGPLLQQFMIGEVLDAKYRLDKHLGAGGMGAVYLATHLGTTRVVAVKLIASKWAADPQFLARFQREAQACGRLRHPNIVNVTDFGIAKASRGDMPYLVMEYLDGQTLSDFQKANPRIPLPVIADLLDQIGLALGEAERHGIVHRDLKPDNIWLEPNGRGGYTAKVLDFGVAKLNSTGDWVASTQPAAVVQGGTEAASSPAISADATETIAMSMASAEELETVVIPAASSGWSSGSFDSGPDAHTRPGSMLGTPAYMSPEQAFGREVTFQSDVYSLAVVAYSLVCGKLPFSGKASELLEYHESGKPVPPADIAKIPRDVSDAILAGLARNPADRPVSAIVFTRRFHNAVDAEFLALRRSKAFLLQHLGVYSLLLIPVSAIILSITILLELSKKWLPIAGVRIVVTPVVAAGLLIFADNLLRAAAALIALDEQVRLRRFVFFRVAWRLVKMLPMLIVTQTSSVFFWGSGWVTGDCLWPVICAVEKLRGRAALQRSRDLMTGLRSAGRALAIRHFALATLAVADAVTSLGVLWKRGSVGDTNIVISAFWFPILALFAAAPLFLYDRTAANESGALLQLNRTPEVRITSRALSVSSAIWLAVAFIYFVYQPVKSWLFGAR
jgi:serine/threonine protein kinase